MTLDRAGEFIHASAVDSGNRHSRALIAKMGSRPIIVDIGGEGGYPRAWNVNPSNVKSLGPNHGQPIPRHILGRAEELPFPDCSVDLVFVERAPLRRIALQEIVRVVSGSGLVVLRHVAIPDRDCHELAKQIIPGLVTQRITSRGHRAVRESIFCQDIDSIDQLNSLNTFACQVGA